MKGQNLPSIIGLLTTVALVGSACGGSQLTDPGPGKRVEAQVENKIYYSGDTVVVKIKNVSGLTLTFPSSFCRTDLQRFQSGTGTWITAVTAADGCSLVLGTVAPGKTTIMHYHLPNTIGTGFYRLAMPMPVPQNAVAPEPELLSPTFEVNPVALNQ